MAQLGVNIDHVATVRQARKADEPDPVWAAAMAELGGADGITIHLREDRRHIQDRDLRLLKETVRAKLNLELACDNDVLEVAVEVLPDQATLVPERREELTTEGGLDVVAPRKKLPTRSNNCGMPESRSACFSIQTASRSAPPPTWELKPLNCIPDRIARTRGNAQETELQRLAEAGRLIRRCGLTLHAGHGLTYHNVLPIARLEDMCELNIGHSIIARALMVGMQQAVREMKDLIR